MSALMLSAERFAAGEPVLVGGEHDATVFVAVAGQAVVARSLERLRALGGGMVVLALAEAIAERLRLPALGAGARPRIDVPFTAPIDAALGVGGGWSLDDRARTMRVAADPRTQPADLAVPGHVHAARIGEDRPGAAAAALELARLSDRSAAVALCAVVDRAGAAASLADARRDADLRRLPLASSGELRGLVQARRMQQLAVSCALPTRDGVFDAIGYVPGDGGDATIALVHGGVASRDRPLVHVHAACLYGDVLGSTLCDCRAELEAAIGAMVGDGAGVILYGKPAFPTGALCGRERPVDTAVVAGLLRRVGVTSVRLLRPADALASELRGLGVDVAVPEPAA